MQQARTDLKHPGMVFVIGRISDYSKGKADWDAIRAIEVKVAKSDPLSAWVDTDDLNNVNGKDDLHYTPDGYVEFGKRLAAKAVELIRRQEAGPAKW